MRRLFWAAAVAATLSSGCAGCLGFGDAPDDDSRQDNGGKFDPHTAESDATGEVGFGQDAEGGAEVTADAAIDSSANDDRGGSTCDTGPEVSVGNDTGLVAVCGDGKVELAEVCDDGNTEPGDYCSLDCSAETGRCGDGIRQANETCDDGSITQNCDTFVDGGDGTCVAAGTCSPGYVPSEAACVPETATYHVHIYVANDCSMMVDPLEVTVPKGQKARFEWHNHSNDYPVTVWQSYIGGYTDLPPGQTWFEMHEWCANINPYTGYSDISTVEVCPEHRFYIRCQGH